MKPAFVLAPALLLIAHASGAERPSVCKTSAIASSCYQTHGRMMVYNGGYPNLRLWKIGTHDLLGIWSGPLQFAHKEFLNSYPEGDGSELPTNVASAFVRNDSTHTAIYADFEVCPLEPHIPGHMQAACIESAKHLVVKK